MRRGEWSWPRRCTAYGAGLGVGNSRLRPRRGGRGGVRRGRGAGCLPGGAGHDESRPGPSVQCGRDCFGPGGGAGGSGGRRGPPREPYGDCGHAGHARSARSCVGCVVVVRWAGRLGTGAGASTESRPTWPCKPPDRPCGRRPRVRDEPAGRGRAGRPAVLLGRSAGHPVQPRDDRRGGRFGPRYGITALAIGFVVGSALRLACQLVPLQAIGLRLRFSFDLTTPASARSPG
jgi:hypothetical protein